MNTAWVVDGVKEFCFLDEIIDGGFVFKLLSEIYREVLPDGTIRFCLTMTQKRGESVTQGWGGVGRGWMVPEVIILSYVGSNISIIKSNHKRKANQISLSPRHHLAPLTPLLRIKTKYLPVCSGSHLPLQPPLKNSSSFHLAAITPPDDSGRNTVPPSPTPTQHANSLSSSTPSI